MRPSRFVVVSLIVLIAMGVGVNLYIVHLDSAYLAPNAFANKWFSTERPSSSDPVRWPTIPDEIVVEMGTPTKWRQGTYNTSRFLMIQWGDDFAMMNDVMFILEEIRFGVPLTARSTKIVWYASSHTGGTIWPEQHGSAYTPKVTYHPLGLIVNPIIYALPIWFLLILMKHGVLVLKRRRRVARGVCLGCGYDIQDLSVCPECGNLSVQME